MTDLHWGDPVAHTARSVLCDIRRYVSTYVALDIYQQTVVALWIVHSHMTELFNVTPYIAITSDKKRSGKTRLLETCELLVHNPVRTGNITEAALFRIMSAGTRTLLLDEYDTIFGGGRKNELLRAILNASYRRGSPILRTKGNNVESFDMFSPKMLAGIGELPDTVMDRSIPIKLRRSTPPVRFRIDEVEPVATALKERIGAAFYHEKLLRRIYEHKPSLPEHLHDRQQDSWEPLLQIAEVIGWAEEGQGAAIGIYKTPDERKPWETAADHRQP